MIIFFLFTVCQLLAGQENTLPNILFIHTDDLGYHDLSHTGSEIYQTPNIDQLAGNALKFERAYSSYPRCTPSRYAMMTGTYPVNEDHGHLAGIPDGKNFIKILRNAGYITSYVGKWHLGGGVNAPTQVGFHHSFAAGATGGVGSHFYPFNTQKRKDAGNPDRLIEDAEETGQPGDYLADLLTDQTMQFIRNASTEQPFFAMLAFYAVHTPLEAKPEDRARNKKEIEAHDYGSVPEYIPEGTGRRKMRQDHPDYAGMVENVDRNVGRLIHLLEERNLLDNTIIVFSSDHGGLSNDGERRRELATTNMPLRAGKGHLYEGGIRVPLLFCWKDRIPPGTDDENIILGMDLFPTLLDLTIGHRVAGIDGRSYYPVLQGLDNWSDRTVFWHEEKARPHSTGDSKCSVIRKGPYKLMHFYGMDKTELYNTNVDISETKDLSGAQPQRVKAMLKELQAWKKAYLVPEKMDMKKNARRSAKKAKNDLHKE